MPVGNTDNEPYHLGEMVAHNNHRAYFVVEVGPGGVFGLSLTADGKAELRATAADFMPISEATNMILAQALAAGEISPDQIIYVKLKANQG